MAQERIAHLRVILVLVQSLDGRITRGTESNIYAWASAEDSQLFFRLIANHHVIIMGRQTYEASKAKIKLRPGTLRIVLTRQPADYATEAVAGQLEFSAESPTALLQRLTLLGQSEVLLVGGSQINAAFLDADLVDELHLTIEPVLFGNGLPLTAELSRGKTLQLKSFRQLNAQGTLYLEYLIKAAS